MEERAFLSFREVERLDILRRAFNEVISWLRQKAIFIYHQHHPNQMGLEDRINEAQVSSFREPDMSDISLPKGIERAETGKWEDNITPHFVRGYNPFSCISDNSLSPPSDFFLPPEYATPQVNWEELWYGTKNSTTATFKLEDEYWTTPAIQDVEEEMLTETKAVDIMMQVQYEAAANTLGTVSFEKRRRLNFHILFNIATFKAWESLYAVTREVNYAPPR